MSEQVLPLLPVLRPLSGYAEIPGPEMARRAREFQEIMLRRRSVRQFSARPVPADIIRDCLRVANHAPSGANMQPWHFVVVTEVERKRQIRAAAEAEERVFYGGRAPKEWLEALAPLGTDEHKPYLETAPYLIVIFSQTYSRLPDGRRVKNYYVAESVGIATGMLITAFHLAGLVTLTHTPSPMGFLNGLLDRPANEKPYLILVAGYPAEDARVPDIRKKSIEETVTFL